MKSIPMSKNRRHVITLWLGASILPHYGAGETVCKPLLAAVANAIFDATGVRLRRVPFRDARVLAALRTAKV